MYQLSSWLILLDVYIQHKNLFQSWSVVPAKDMTHFSLAWGHRSFGYKQNKLSFVSYSRLHLILTSDLCSAGTTRHIQTLNLELKILKECMCLMKYQAEPR